MNRRVYAVMHSDIEEYSVRGLFSSEAVAKAVVTLSESTDGTWWRSHGDHCCDVVEMAVADRPPEVFHGPPKPYEPGSGLISDALIERLAAEMARRPFPLFDLFRQRNPPEPASGVVYLYHDDQLKTPVGEVEAIDDEDGNITIRARLKP